MKGARVGHVVLGVDAAELTSLADLAARDDLRAERHHRVLEVVEADEGLHARPCSAASAISLRFGGVRRERLLAIDRLAGGDRRKRDRLVERVGRGDVDEVDGRVCDQRPPVAGRAREAERMAARSARRRIRHVVRGTGATGRSNTAGAIARRSAWLRPMNPLPIRPTLAASWHYASTWGLTTTARIEPAVERGKDVLGRARPCRTIASAVGPAMCGQRGQLSAPSSGWSRGGGSSSKTSRPAPRRCASRQRLGQRRLVDQPAARRVDRGSPAASSRGAARAPIMPRVLGPAAGAARRSRPAPAPPSRPAAGAQPAAAAFRRQRHRGHRPATRMPKAWARARHRAADPAEAEQQQRLAGELGRRAKLIADRPVAVRTRGVVGARAAWPARSIMKSACSATATALTSPTTVSGMPRRSSAARSTLS